MKEREEQGGKWTTQAGQDGMVEAKQAKSLCTSYLCNRGLTTFAPQAVYACFLFTLFTGL